MDMLKGKVAVVTGGTRGIGYSIVETFLRNGATVVLLGSRQETVDKALASLKEADPAWRWRALPEAGRLQRHAGAVCPAA